MTRPTNVSDAFGSEPNPDRRQLLRRLGLVAVTAYAAPALLNLAPARASGGSYSAPSYSAPSGPSRSRSSSGSSGPRRSSGVTTGRSTSARGCSFSSGSGGCRVPRRRVRRVRRPRFLRRFLGGSG